MTAPYPSVGNMERTRPGVRARSAARYESGTAAIGEPSLGELIGNITEDMSLLMRKEIALAKAELREEAVKAGKGAGMFGGAGFAAYLTVVLLSFAAVFG